MDIQPYEAIAYYICKCIAKSEPMDMNESLAQAIERIQLVLKKIIKAGGRFLRERQVSASKCVYRLCHLTLRQSSRKRCFCQYMYD
jgi:hypothetical protein